MATKKPPVKRPPVKSAPVKKPPVKSAPVKKPPVKQTTKKPVKKAAASSIVIDVSSGTKSASSMLDKAIDLIKWVDTPFKLFEVILLASVFFFGYFAWDSRTVILEAITHSSKVTNLKEVNHLFRLLQVYKKT